MMIIIPPLIAASIETLIALLFFLSADTYCGKTALCHRYVKGCYDNERILTPTIGLGECWY